MLSFSDNCWWNQILERRERFHRYIEMTYLWNTHTHARTAVSDTHLTKCYFDVNKLRLYATPDAPTSQ